MRHQFLSSNYSLHIMNIIQSYLSSYLINPFVPNAPFLYPLSFQGVEKGAQRTNGLNV